MNYKVDIEKNRKEISEEVKENNWKPELDDDIVNESECYVQRSKIDLNKENSVNIRVFLDASII